jgi:hypothetical protein
MTKRFCKPHSARIIQLYDAGERDTYVLAERCGVTANIVQKCLARHRLNTTAPIAASRNKRIVQVRVPDAIIAAARRRGTHPNKLVNALISVIARENLINAVMDDDEDESTWEPIGKAATRVVEKLGDRGKENGSNQNDKARILAARGSKCPTRIDASTSSRTAQLR